MQSQQFVFVLGKSSAKKQRKEILVASSFSRKMYLDRVGNAWNCDFRDIAGSIVQPTLDGSCVKLTVWLAEKKKWQELFPIGSSELLIWHLKSFQLQFLNAGFIFLTCGQIIAISGI